MVAPVLVVVAARTGESAWDNSDIAWSPSGNVVAVFAGRAAQGLGSVLASRVAASTVPPGASARERATAAIREAHAITRAATDPDTGVLSPGAFGTMASFAWGDEAVVAHAGDARVYRMRPLLHEVECLTRDDVAGDTEPMNWMLTNAVGHGEEIQIHECQIACAPQDVIVCCTSRVWRTLGDEELLAIVTRSREDAPAAIIQRVAELAPTGGSAVAIVFW